MTNDPRDFVTSDAFTVAPELLGRPLAKPWRRLGAMLVDLVAIGLLSKLSAIVLGVAGAAMCVRAGLKQADPRARFRRVALFALAALILVLAIGGTLTSRSGAPLVQVGSGDRAVAMQPREALAFVGEVVALNDADTQAERDAAAQALVDAVRSAQPDRVAARAMLRNLLGDLTDPDEKAALQDAIDAMPESKGAGADPALVQRYAEALAAKSADAETLRTQLAPVVAEPELASAEAKLRECEGREASLESRVTALSKPRGVRGWLRSAADDLGLGFGWAVVYFTALTAFWKGRTLGKGLFGCRVARLDAKPLTWWHAFNRAGGYAASLATGLLGFAELIWDPNRQALHDRISRTVVLRDRVDSPD